jgi:hypothetical protein
MVILRHRRGALLAVLATLATVSLAMLCVKRHMEQWRARVRALWDQVAIGDSEAHVRQILGAPGRAYDKATAPPDYYVDGWQRPEREITNKVLIYFGADMVFYVWIDEEGKVEETFRGGS